MSSNSDRYLTLEDIHQDVGNLYFLWDLLRDDKRCCSGLLAFTGLLVAAISEIARLMEDTVDWDSAQDAIANKGKQKPALKAVVPKVEDIKVVKTLGEGGIRRLQSFREHLRDFEGQ